MSDKKITAQDALDNDWDWFYIYKLLYLKIKKMAHVFHKDEHHDNKQHIRDMWKATRPLKRLMNEDVYWPREAKDVDELGDECWEDTYNGSYQQDVWYDSRGRDTGTRTRKVYKWNDGATHAVEGNPDILQAEQNYFEEQWEEFAHLMAKYSRNWWI